MSIRVVLADDHPVVRAGLRAVIEKSKEDIVIVDEAINGKEVLEIAEKKPVDIFLLDVEMPHLNGIETAERLLKKDPKAKIIILSIHDSRIFVQRALRCGVKGYILKESATEEMIQAILEVFKGRFFLSPGISDFIVDGFLGKVSAAKDKSAGNGLTKREREIVQLIGEGCTNKEIAQKLNLYLNTVQVHRRNLMQKLNIHKQADLIRYTIKEGISKL
ncbi:MAG: response regulator transcription factor [Candidatus Aminicenantes bacterium]|nr:response regulator transcription factor [Candidatus Aminicenantes bacterium]